MAMANRAIASVPSPGTGAKLMPRISAPISTDGQDAAEVVDRLGRLVDVAGHEADGHDQGDRGERQRDEEDRAPLEMLEQEARDQRPEGGDRPPSADHSAIERVRAGPDHNAAISASVVG